MMQTDYVITTTRPDIVVKDQLINQEVVDDRYVCSTIWGMIGKRESKNIP